ncbi:hypothetical protein ACFQ51_26660 [Streptomyces kaempferi]
MNNSAVLALGATVLCGTLAVAGVHTYASGRAQRQALVDRLAGGGRCARPRAAYAASPPSTAGCAAPVSAAPSTCVCRRRAST